MPATVLVAGTSIVVEVSTGGTTVEVSTWGTGAGLARAAAMKVKTRTLERIVGVGVW